jgi:3-hydroxyisobutyrate dehydrogenase-like beta-hydroxyacid dehydrogenase
MVGTKNSDIDLTVAVLGLGEAGSRFANDLAALGVSVRGWDPKPKHALHEGVFFAKSNAHAVQGVDIIFNVNLSSVAESVAREILPKLEPKQFFLEMNTASPEQKKAIFAILQPKGVQFVDLAIMAPVPPKGLKTPFSASGPGAIALSKKLKDLGLNLSILGPEVGEASTQKLLRSIVYKGVAAVICEAMEAGQAFGLEPYMRAQISSVIGDSDGLIDRFVEGSHTHAVRRMHEMEAVVAMLEAKGLEALMSRATKENLGKLWMENNIK